MKINHGSTIYLILVFFFIIPIFFYGSFDKEEFNYSFVATKIISDNLSNFFYKNFSDQFGFGINFPFGTGMYFFPNLILNKITYFLSSILFCLLIQYFFFSKILSLVKLNQNFFLIFIVVFSPINIRYSFYHDWISHLFVYSLSFGVIYYLLKIFYNKKIELSYLKLFFLTALSILNSHIGHISAYCIIFFTFFLYNFNARKILKLKYLFYLFILIIIIFYKFYFLLDVFYQTKDGLRLRLGEYNSYDIISGFIQPLFTVVKILQAVFSNLGLENDNTKNLYFYLKDLINQQSGHNQRLHMFIGIFEYSMIFLFILYLKKNVNFRKQSLYIFDIIILSLILTLVPIEFIPTFISSSQYFSELIYIFSILLFLKLHTTKKKFFPKIIKILVIICLTLNFIEGVNLIKNSNNYYTHKYGEFFTKINLTSNELNRIYISPKIYADINGKKDKNDNFFLSQGIYDVKELYNFNFQPINVNVKNSHGIIPSKSSVKMNWEFYPSYKEISSDIFFNLFNIKFLLIYESELVNIKAVSNSFTIIKDKTFNNKKILLLKKKNSKHVLLRNITKKKTCELSEALFNCIELLKNNFDLINSNNINLIRIEDSNYIVKNNSNNKINYVFPFFNDKNWYIGNKLFVENNFFITVEIQPHASINIKHKNNIFKYQKITSFIFLFILVLLIIFKSSKKKIKYL
jgi:hypothetical protein